MSNLLFNERPLVVSPKLAEALGDVDKAIILQQLHYWVQKSGHIKNGRRWVYNTMKGWQKQFPWIKSTTSLDNKFKSLIKLGLVLDDNFNQAKFDRTKWYTIDYEAFSEFERAFTKNWEMETPKNGECKNQELVNGNTNNCETNTIDYTETTTESNTEDILPGKPDGIPYSEIVDYLNQKARKKFKATTDKTKRLIKARFNEGFGVADFKQVVDNQTQAWLHDSKMSKYLRPETLFGPKFESYLNARPAKQQQGGGINGVYF